MKLLIFDMDGVLLKPLGYHRALQDTVRLAARSMGYGDIGLREDQIARFEALGISSEWHSSALCLATLTLEKQKDGQSESQDFDPSSGDLDLEELFSVIASQPMGQPALERAKSAIEHIAAKTGIPPHLAIEIVSSSESIVNSTTMNIFQELILGSETFETIYQKKARFQTESYLMKFDLDLLTKESADKVLGWASQPGQGAAIMTNRPSIGLPGGESAPDADMGASLVGLDTLPLVGFGEITWLAAQMGMDAGALAKPAWQHAMTAILAAGGWTMEESLRYAGTSPETWRQADLQHLQGSTITVFEDTPGGLVSVQEAVNMLGNVDLQVEVRKIGIAAEEQKNLALAAQGAAVYPSLNRALADLDDF